MVRVVGRSRGGPHPACAAPAGSSAPASVSTRSLILSSSTLRKASRPRLTASGPPGSSARATSVRASALLTSGRRLREVAPQRLRLRLLDRRSLTIAEESMWVDGAQRSSRLSPASPRRGRLEPGRQRQRLRQIREVGFGRLQISRGSQTLDRILGQGPEHRNRTPRSVIWMLSPSSTRRSNSLARCRSSLTPTLVMCYL